MSSASSSASCAPSSSATAAAVSKMDQDISRLQAQIVQITREKKEATLSKAISETSVEELERLLREMKADRKKAAEQKAIQEAEDSMRALNFKSHTGFTHHTKEMQVALTAISRWAIEEFCALEDFGKVMDQMMKVTGVLGFRKNEPYAMEDLMPFTRQQLENNILSSEARGLKLITAVIDLVKVLGLEGEVVNKLGAQTIQMANIVAQGAEKKRKFTPKRCKCAKGKCSKAESGGNMCGCTADGVICSHLCACEGTCKNPLNDKEAEEARIHREAYEEAEGPHNRAQLEKYAAIIAAAKSSVMHIDQPASKREPLVLDSWYQALFVQHADAIMARVVSEVKFIDRTELEPFKIYGNESSLPRDKAFYGDIEKDGSFPVYRYDRNLKHYPTPLPWVPVISEMRDLIEKATGQRCNHAVINRYLTGKDHIGFHDDKTRDIVPGSHIFTISLGDKRLLRIKSNADENVVEKYLEHGSLNQLGWATNLCSQHAIMARANVGLRFGLTFRSIKTQSRDMDVVIVDAPKNVDAPKKRGRKPRANNVAAEPERTTAELIAELDKFIGIDRVKLEVKKLLNTIEFNKKRAAQGHSIPVISRHMIFRGSPGTGKTTIAVLLAKIFKSMGILSKGHLVEKDRETLVAGYVGATAIKTAEAIKDALGGILFIDEAYALNENEFGKEAISTIMLRMEEHREDLIVIAAGYDEDMDAFVAINPGLKSRFSVNIHFDDFSLPQLRAVFHKFTDEHKINLDAAAKAKLDSVLATMYENRGPEFGNGRDVRNVFEAAYKDMSDRMDEDVTRMDASDIRLL